MLRRILTIIPLVLLCGAALLLFFINLTGANNSGVLGEFYWSEVDNAKDFGLPWDKARWTLYSICGVKGGRNYDCSSTTPAYPYSPVDNFSSTDNVPQSFIDNRDTYYYLSRFAYAFFLIGIVFSIIGLIPTLLSCCVKGFVTGILSSVAIGIALLFTLAGACVVTGCHVLGRNAFNDNGYNSSVSAKTFGILWAAVACLLISFIWMCVVSAKGGIKKHRKNGEDHESYAEHKEPSSEFSHYNENSSYNNEAAYNNDAAYNNNAYNEQSSYNQYEAEEAPKKKKFFFSRS